jgi:hypothetical protein
MKKTHHFFALHLYNLRACQEGSLALESLYQYFNTYKGAMSIPLTYKPINLKK